MISLRRILLSLIVITAPFSAGQAMQSEQQDVILTDDLFEAISDIDILSLTIALADGADVDTLNQKGETPLMLAAHVGNSRIVKILLAHDPDLNKQSKSGHTALMIASASGQQHVVEQLIQKGADLNKRNNSGFNSIELAVRNGHRSIATLLRSQNGISLTGSE
ncbi:MAG: ankyrin repeat domain-containing protein [Balneolaceae bacterium]